MKTVYVVLQGEDCEGAEICSVFAEKEDAIKYINTEFPDWQRIEAEDEWRRGYWWNGQFCKGCTSVYIEEWEVS